MLLSHSFELSKSISGRDCVSVKKELATNIAKMNKKITAEKNSHDLNYCF